MMNIVGNKPGASGLVVDDGGRSHERCEEILSHSFLRVITSTRRRSPRRRAQYPVVPAAVSHCECATCKPRLTPLPASRSFLTGRESDPRTSRSRSTTPSPAPGSLLLPLAGFVPSRQSGRARSHLRHRRRASRRSAESTVSAIRSCVDSSHELLALLEVARAAQ